MRVVVTGGRAFPDEAYLRTMADRWARYVAVVPVTVFHAWWFKHGRAAGPLRNDRMLREFKPDLVVAFPGGAGTADCVHRARALGIEVLEY